MAADGNSLSALLPHAYGYGNHLLMLKRLLNPNFIIFTVLGVSVIAFGNVRQVRDLMATFPHFYLLWFLFLIIAFEVVRAAQWHFLLASLDIRPPPSIRIFAWLTSEIATLVPIGNYFEDDILERAEGADIGRSPATATLGGLIEVGVSLLGVVVLGLGSWTGWLWPLIVGGVLVFALLAWLVHGRHHTHGPPRQIMDHPLAQTAREELQRFRHGTAELLNSRVLAVTTGLGTVYLVIAGAALYLVARGLAGPGSAVTHIAYGTALAVYFFGLAFSLIFLLSVNIGVLELSGTGAWLALGLSRTSVVSIVLVYRNLSLASPLLIALFGIAVLHEGLRVVLSGRSQPPRERSGPLDDQLCAPLPDAASGQSGLHRRGRAS
jgi:hypothetical protein